MEMAKVRMVNIMRKMLRLSQHLQRKKKLSYLYVYFNIVSNPAQKMANLSVRIVVNEVSDSCI